MGVGFLAWNIIIVTIAVVITANTRGENVGKFVGTVGSAIAFLPPAWFVWQWYQQRAAEDRLRVSLLHLGERAQAETRLSNQVPNPADSAP